MGRIALGLAASAALLAASAAARADGFSVGGGGGGMEFDTRASLGESGLAWGLRGGIGLFGPARLEARFLSAARDLDNGYSASAREGDAQIRLALLPHTAVTPYAFGGFGIRVSDVSMPGPHVSDGCLVVPIGGGLDLPLWDHFVMAPEFTWHHRLGEPPPPEAPPASGNDTWNVSLVVRLDL